jgi:hypothetical protein
VIEIKFIDGMVHIMTTKALLVMPRETFVQALKHGKSYRRRRSLDARMSPTPEGAFREMTKGVTSTRGEDVRHRADPE